MYYIAIKNGDDVIYIYRHTEPKIGDTIYYNNKTWTVTGYMPTAFFE